MHLTLHITSGCNLNCSYCYAPPVDRHDMTEEVLSRSIRFIAGLSRENAGIVFFGGEPLLRKDLVKLAMAQCEKLRRSDGFTYHTKIVTNGLLLDEEFAEWATSVRLAIALSLDGVQEAHNTHRRSRDNEPSFEKVDRAASLLLKYQPYASVLTTITPQTVGYYADSMDYLLKKGFKYLIVSLHYAGTWTGKDLLVLIKQYAKIAKRYEQLSLDGSKFYFSPFEVKLSTHIRGKESQCHRCALAQRQISVAPDGGLFPCVQFVRNRFNKAYYQIGDVFNGIDEEKRAYLFKKSRAQNEECLRCAFNQRCNNNCSCLNWQTTRDINRVSPVLCETERILIPLVDKLGERLYKKNAQAFIQKHYNPAYPYFSLLEEVKCVI
jgi:uncharacterized protein